MAKDRKAFMKVLPPSNNPRTTRDQDFGDISELELAFLPEEKGLYHISLTAADTWNAQAGSGAAFAIVLNTQPIAQGFYTSGVAGQVVPIHIETIVEIDRQRTIVEAKWRTHNGGEASIGGVGKTTRLLIIPLVQVSELSEGE